MDDRDRSIIAQVCVKAAGQLHGHAGWQDIADVVATAEILETWVLDADTREMSRAATTVRVTTAPNYQEPKVRMYQTPQQQPQSNKPQCPECKGEMWDNRPKKAKGEYKPNSPDFACKDKNCSGRIWPS